MVLNFVFAVEFEPQNTEQGISNVEVMKFNDTFYFYIPDFRSRL
jgi:hypothetical protein